MKFYVCVGRWLVGSWDVMFGAIVSVLQATDEEFRVCKRTSRSKDVKAQLQESLNATMARLKTDEAQVRWSCFCNCTQDQTAQLQSCHGCDLGPTEVSCGVN